MDSKTATERLRELLDESKADYRVHQGIINGSMSYYDRYTVLTDGSPCAFIDTGNGDEVVLTLRCTPEQAIAATLGGGECEVELRESGWGGYTRHCGDCGADLDCDTRNKQNYCPKCGRKVKR